ncbi:MAG: hypothetical protein B6I20_09045 [Bacteroidetes bacterium 4572_117]|nr:MAG: hypothetical protein B6I20_09045 [Bacteroidetes bacterium 4572_117]
MKTKLFLFSFFGIIIFVLTACPYQSAVPIDEAIVKVDNKVLGKWIKNSDLEKDNPEYFEISAIDKYKYSIVKFEYQSSDSTYKETKYITHFTNIEDYVFMNMQENGKDDYYLHRMDLKGNEFSLYEVTDNIDEKFTDSKKLKKFIKKNMKLSFFYNKDETKYVRSK